MFSALSHGLGGSQIEWREGNHRSHLEPGRMQSLPKPYVFFLIIRGINNYFYNASA